MTICVLIPAFNAASSIGALVQQVRRHGFDIVVVDDGSRDATVAIAEAAGARVLQHDVNRGKGAALHTGFAETLRQGYEAIITMDADGQHDPEDLRRFIQAALDHPQALMIIGNRLQESARMPFVRRWTNRTMSWWLSRLARCDVPDSQCGFRLMRRELLERCRLRSAHFEIESELVLEAARLGGVIASMPIHAVYRGERSHIHPVRDTLRFFRLLASYRQRHPTDIPP